MPRQSPWVTRSVAAFAVVGVASLLVLSLVTLRLSDRALRREADTRVRSTSQSASALVSQEMVSLGELVAAFTNRPSLQRATASGLPDDPSLSAMLAQLHGARPQIEAAFVTDAAGHLAGVYPPAPGMIGKDLTFRDWYRGAMNAGGVYVSASYESMAANPQAVVAVAAPIKDADGRVVGVLGTSYYLDALRQGAEAFGRTQGATITVVDQSEAVLAGTTSAGAVGAAQKAAHTTALRGRSALYRIRGFDVAATPVAGTGWAVSAVVPIKVISGAINDLRGTVLMLAGVLGILFLGAIGLMAVALRRRAEADRKVMDSERRLDLLLSSTSDAVFGQDADGRCTFANPAACALTGFGPEELLGRSLHEMIHHSYVDGSPYPEDACRIRLARDRGSRITVDDEVVWRKDGTAVDVVYTAEPVSLDGEPPSVVLTVRDVTAERRARAELAHAHAEALEASQLKSAFLANMSHEIRTPMNGVIGMTSLLLQSDLDHEQRSYAEMIRSSADALLTIINDILDFSKIEAGKLEIDTADFDIRVTIEDCVDLLADQASEKGLELAALISPDVPVALRGDPLRLRQVLVNLVSNAVKFTPHGEVVVRAGVSREDADSVTMRFEVTDTGIGISPERQRELFEPFVQADTTTTRRYGGTGLGLTISRQLVELMGGEIGVRSVPDHGSTFWFTVPFQAADSPAAHALAPALEGLESLRVLVLDDNRTNQVVLGQMLAGWGVTTTVTGDAGRALEALRAAAKAGEPFDVAALDFNMPGVTGVDVGRAIRDDPLIAGTRLILLTSSGHRDEATDATAAGFDGFLPKPVRQDALHRVLATVAGQPDRGAMVTAAVARDLEARYRRRVLVVEDNVVNQTVAAKMLERGGHSVDVVDDGAAALTAIEQNRYDVVLMDVQMPGMDGYEATRELRRREAATGTRRTRVIAMTASARAEDRQRCLEAGMDDFISKPIGREQLLEVVAGAGEAPPEGADGDVEEGTRATTEPEADAMPLGNGRARREAPPDPAERAGDGESSVLDEAALDSLRSLDPEGRLPDRLVDLFLSESAGRVEQLREAARDRDADRVRRLAHGFKGSAGYFGAARLLAVCRDLEKHATDASPAELEASAEEVASCFAEAKAAIDAVRERERTR